MSAELTDQFLAALADSGLLTPAQSAELAAWRAASGAGANRLVKELRARGWLSDYQLREVARGRGAGLTVGPYRLIEPVGEGGMGVVYKAAHTRLGRVVALKLIRPERLARPRALERFRRETRAAGQLSHPNVVVAIDADQVGSRHYIAMEFVPGTDLARLVESGGPLAVEAACDYARQAAAGLQHAHDRGLVHRDIKPSNLLLTPRGEVKVTDLGLAISADEADGRLTQDGNVLGTPDFLAPEQVRDPGGVDGRADVYALGATLYYLLTGRLPYEGASSADKLVQHLTAPPPSLAAARPDAPPALDAAIQAMMAKRPEDRPQTPAAAARLLASALAETEEVEAVEDDGLAFAGAVPEPPPRAPRPAKPRRGALPIILVGVAALAVLALGAAVGTLALGGRGGGAPIAPTANAAGIELAEVPGGQFPAGDPPAEVTVAGPFYVGVTEVTEGQYLKVVRPSPALWPRRSRTPAQIPVDRVTWDEANEFCRKLTAASPVPPGWAYRLPTEAEWEYACRAGTTGPFNGAPKLVFGKGGVFDPDAKGDALGEEDVTRTKMERGFPYPAGTSAANAFGLKDCHGNVWEWTASPSVPAADPKPGAFRVARGGSWREPASNCTSSSRRGLSPTERQDDVGFRVVLAAR